jgi:hypothetical protein
LQRLLQEALLGQQARPHFVLDIEGLEGNSIFRKLVFLAPFVAELEGSLVEVALELFVYV